MLDIAQSVLSQVSIIFKLQENELNLSEARSIEGQSRLIENRRKTISAKFKSGLSMRKLLGF